MGVGLLSLALLLFGNAVLVGVLFLLVAMVFVSYLFKSKIYREEEDKLMNKNKIV